MAKAVVLQPQTYLCVQDRHGDWWFKNMEPRKAWFARVRKSCVLAFDLPPAYVTVLPAFRTRGGDMYIRILNEFTLIHVPRYIIDISAERWRGDTPVLGWSRTIPRHRDHVYALPADLVPHNL